MAWLNARAVAPSATPIDASMPVILAMWRTGTGRHALLALKRPLTALREARRGPFRPLEAPSRGPSRPLQVPRGAGGGGTGARRSGSGGGQRQQQQRRSETLSPQQLHLRAVPHCFSRLNDAWRAEFGDNVVLPRWADLIKSRIAIFDLDFDAILYAIYALSASAEGDCYRCVSPDPGIAAAALGASASGTLPGTAPAEALHTFTLDSGASRCFFRDNTTLTPLPAPVPVRLADPSGGPVVARSSTVLPCPAVPSGSLSGLHLPSFSTNLVSTAALQDAMVTTTTPGGQRVSICTCTRTGRHLATFTCRPGSSLYTLATEPSQ
ncbi:unnamed protein product [Closterium sp. NIES-53]